MYQNNINMGFAKQYKKQGASKTAGMIRTTPLTKAEMDEVIAAEEALKEAEGNKVNTLWGPGTKYDTQADYQRSCMGSKYKY